MNWKLKCAAFYLMKCVPFGEAFHRVAQRRITGRYFEQVTPDVLAAYDYHVRNFRELPPGATALEFGAGRNLLASLLLSHAGAARVLAYDLERLASVEQLNAIIAQLRSLRPGNWPELSSLDDLARLYRIEYRAPADARTTGLAASSVDFIHSTSVLEHIPADQIRAILMECQRIASARAVISFIIDYHDHYATADPSISRVNFYRYSDALWRVFNPSQHFQNRLRHSDYEKLFAELGLEPIDCRPIIKPVPIDRSIMHPRFRQYSDTDLIALNGLFLMRAKASNLHAQVTKSADEMRKGLKPGKNDDVQSGAFAGSV